METLKADALSRYRHKIESFTHVSNEDFEQLAAVMHEKQLNRGEVILKEGQVCKHYYFIIKGCIRSFSIKEGREVNVNFYFEDDVACDFSSFRNEEPSEFYMVAMENCTVFCASKAEALPVFINHTSLHIYLFRFFQYLYLKEEEHSNSFKLLTPEERYHFIVENQPYYLQRIPMIYLASYLGISRETLTRIRGRKS
jgi:CRP-like cAMP-binding protein